MNGLNKEVRKDDPLNDSLWQSIGISDLTDGKIAYFLFQLAIQELSPSDSLSHEKSLLPLTGSSNVNRKRSDDEACQIFGEDQTEQSKLDNPLKSVRYSLHIVS